LTSGQRAERLESIASESLQKTRTKFYEIAGYKSVITNHLRMMFRSHML